MFASIVRFELAYQLRNPVFVVTTVIFFLLTFGAVTIDNIQIGSGGNVHVNSPQAIGQTVLIMTLFYMFASTAFVANVVVRDDESGFGPMVRSTSVTKFAYLIGRYFGAFIAAAAGFAAVPFAIFFGSLMPWLDQETLGPNVLSHYLTVFAVFAVPNILVTSAIFFAVACVFRSMMLSYVGVLVFLVAYFTLTSIAGSQPDLRDTIAMVEPFGIGAFSDATRYWSAAESNSMLPPFEGALMVNRLFVAGLALVALGIAYWRYSFAEKGLSARKLKKEQAKAEKAAAEQPATVDQLPNPDQRAAAWPRLIGRTRIEMNLIFTSPAFFVLILIGLLNSWGALWFANQVYGTPAVPMTFSLLLPLLGSFGIIPIIIAIYFAGELVWRDRDRGMHEIIDSTALPNWAYFIPKVIAVAAVLVATLAIAMLAAITVQLLRGYTAIEIDKYLLWFLLPLSVDMLMTAILAVFLQALSSSKYMGWGLMGLYLVASITLVSIGFEHPLYNFGDVGFVMVSDLNGTDVGGDKSWWLRLYWSGVCLILSVLAYLLWRRGVAVSIRSQIARLPTRFVGVPAAIAASGLLISVVTGSWLFYQMNVVNDYVTSDESDELRADYEKSFLQYETVKQPSATHIDLKVDLYPHEGRAYFEGTYQLVNDTGAPVSELHVVFQDGRTEITSLDIPNGTLTLDEDEQFGYQIYTLDPALAPGEMMEMSFTSERIQTAFSTRGEDTRLVKNGTFLNNAEFAPQLGFDRSALLQDRATRRKYDLPAELRMPKLEDEAARERNYVGNADWVMADITVTTRADQVPIAPGKLVSDITAGDRRTVRFQSQNPILAFFSIQSADYAVTSRQHNDIAMEIFHHPTHDFNAERMLEAMAVSLDYFEENFGPYQFDYARVIEFPGYATFAQAFAGTVPYSERIGFIANTADEDDIDYVTYVTAHEYGHQYWAHQLISAYMQGGTVMVETMAQYSALMVMKQIYGEEQIRRFLKYELDAYLSSRGSEVIEELPLIRVENQGYIHYRKGAVVMYLLQDRLGEDRVNEMLADLLERYRFKGQPYASATDLADGFKSLARDEAESRLVADLLENITLYDFAASDAVVTEREDGSFETVFTVSAEKTYADGEGEETEASFDNLVDVGAFTKRPGYEVLEPVDVLHMELQSLKSGEQSISLITETKPSFVGVDPYSKFVDRKGDDNIVAVEDAD